VTSEIDPSAQEPSPSPAGASDAARFRRSRFRLLVTLAALLAGPLLAEAGLRYQIFHGSAPGDAIRDPRRYADPYSDDEYYKLQHALSPPGKRREAPGFDPLVGWLGGAIEPLTYTHRDVASLQGRRPVLLYGASYAQCATPMADCFQHIMEEESELADRYGILNYGVGNSGIDQMYLLLRESLDHYADQDPVVVIGAVLETDFDRCMVSFRGWPKPHFSLTDDGGVQLDGPVIEGVDAYLAEHPLQIRSYLWNLMLYGSEWLPDPLRAALSGRERTMAHKQELIERLVVAIQHEVESRDLDVFFVLFCRKFAVASPPQIAWQEEFMTDLLERRGIPYVLAKDVLVRAGQKQGRDPVEFFLPDGVHKNHPSPEGNRVLFETIRRGLDGRFDGGGGGLAPHLSSSLDEDG
jgi:hypothetical protein